MFLVTACTMAMALLTNVSGENTGWHTGEVHFIGYVNNDEHQEIYPICKGQYTVNVTIEQILDDPKGALEYTTSVQLCYDYEYNLRYGDMIEITGTSYQGASPLPFYKSVVVDSIYDWEPPDDDDSEDEEIDYPSVSTVSAEATERKATFQGRLRSDGGAATQVRFVYYPVLGGKGWHTQWEEAWSGYNFTHTVTNLVPNTHYYFYAEAKNSAGFDTGFSGQFQTLPETTPPIPHPTIWKKVPHPLNKMHLSMTAEIGRDIAGPEQYFFDFVESPTGGNGGSDSIWQLDPEFIDVGLNSNHQYGYRVKARDGLRNETAYSPIQYAYTAIEIPESIEFGEITTTSIQSRCRTSPSNLHFGKSGLMFENKTAHQISDWQNNNNFWTSSGLLPNTQYAFRAQARNGDGIVSTFGRSEVIHTHADIPDISGFSKVSLSSIKVHWNPQGNPLGTLYWCKNKTTQNNSGWISSLQWHDSNLSPNQEYTYHMKARNGDHVETAMSTIAKHFSAIEPSTGIIFGPITADSISIRSTNTPTNLNKGLSGLRFENQTTGQGSPWQQHNNDWLCQELRPNTAYTFYVQTRNGNGVTTQKSPANTAYTGAHSPLSDSFSNITENSIRINWQANDNPVGTQYRVENTSNGTNSGWITTTHWDNFDLAPFTEYTYRVKARNHDSMETTWTELGTVMTGSRSLTLSSTTGGTVILPGEDVFYYAAGTEVEINALAEKGYHFTHWSGTAVDAGYVTNPNRNETSVFVEANYTLEANFLKTVIYVDTRATGKNTGNTWEHAFVSLQDALDIAQRGNEIHVAQGIYMPDMGQGRVPGDITLSFELPNQVILQGGYAGLGNLNPDDRDIQQYHTILSGDLTGNDSHIRDVHELYGEQTYLDNSLHVLTSIGTDANTVLEGVTIIGGNGIDGAGIQLFRSELIIDQCTIRGNRSGRLSGDGLDGWGQGAGLSCFHGNPSIVKTSFEYNWSGAFGGAIYTLNAYPYIEECTFIENHAGIEGGAIHIENGSGITINSNFLYNRSTDGGAISTQGYNDCRFTNCRFMGNGSFQSGGAVMAAGNNLHLINCIFSGNLAHYHGGGIASMHGNTHLINCSFNENKANKDLSIEYASGGQALYVSDANAIIDNCILWNQAERVITLYSVDGGKASLDIDYSTVRGGRSNIVRHGSTALNWGNGNRDTNPIYQDPEGPDQIIGTVDDNLHLTQGSACIDAGNNQAVPADIDDLDGDNNTEERIPIDLASSNRFVDDPQTENTGNPDLPDYPDIIDMGAFEFIP